MIYVLIMIVVGSNSIHSHTIEFTSMQNCGKAAAEIMAATPSQFAKTIATCAVK